MTSTSSSRSTPAPSPEQSAEPYISATGLEMQYQTLRGENLTALAPTDFEVRRGEAVSIIGPSGCGKSTLLSILGGLTRPTKGAVRIAGRDIVRPAPDLCAYVFQDYTLFPWRTVLDNVAVGLEFRGVGRREREEISRQQLELVGLGQFLNAYPTELSGGMKQRAAIARALALDPEVLLMDEPFGALDEQTRLVLGEELTRIVADKTLLFVTHSLAEAVFIADRVVVMSSRPGRIKTVLHIDTPRPRPPAFMTSPEFTRARDELFELLHDEIREAAKFELEQKEERQ